MCTCFLNSVATTRLLNTIDKSYFQGTYFTESGQLFVELWFRFFEKIGSTSTTRRNEMQLGIITSSIAGFACASRTCHGSSLLHAF